MRATVSGDSEGASDGEWCVGRARTDGDVRKPTVRVEGMNGWRLLWVSVLLEYKS